jgi:predicted phosphodiesterase/predicted RNA-binding protein with PIN domain
LLCFYGFLSCSGFSIHPRQSRRITVISVAANSRDNENSQTSSIFPQWLSSQSSSFPSVILIDVENVRGKTNFKLRHEEFVNHANALSRTLSTIDLADFADNHNTKKPKPYVILVIDHGLEQSSLQQGPLDEAVYVIFAGPNHSADQVLMDLTTVARNKTSSVMIVSSDLEVINTCQSRGASVLQSKIFLECLLSSSVNSNNQSSCNWWNVKTKNGAESIIQHSNPVSPNIDPELVAREIIARQELQRIGRILSPSKRQAAGHRGLPRQVSRKQRTKLIARERVIRQRLNNALLETTLSQEGQLIEESVDTTSIRPTENQMSEDWYALIQKIVDATANSATSSRGGIFETTYERQLLAERLRRRLIAAGAVRQTAFLPSWVVSFPEPSYHDVPSSRQFDRLHLNSSTCTNLNTSIISSNGFNLNESFTESSNTSGDGKPIIISIANSSDSENPESQVINYSESNITSESDLGSQVCATDPYVTESLNSEMLKMVDMTSTSKSGNSQSIDLGSRVFTVTRNHRLSTASSDSYQKPIRLLVMSDTHGMEEQMFQYMKQSEECLATSKFAYKLPDADILIHCGDFWGSRSSAMKFDTFLAAQTHIPIKVVVRGNHDPRTPGSVLFPKSRAIYVTKSSTLELTTHQGRDKVIVALRPHSRNVNDAPLLPPQCDILISHVPPLGILDRTYHNQNAGSQVLRQSLEAAIDKPALWLCGHIHEGRGILSHTFTKEKVSQKKFPSTVVVNAATANEGKAKCILHGPILIDLVHTQSEIMDDIYSQNSWLNSAERKISPSQLIRPDSLEALCLVEIQKPKLQFHGEEDSSECLLAVDLGLRTGTAVLDRNGTILAVDSWRFHDHESLQEGLATLLTSHPITHVVLEGEDRKLISIWRKAVMGQTDRTEVALARVVADDWRRMLLSPKERQDTRKAKSAAGLIAKQLLRSHESLRNKKLSHDAAEALLVGWYSLRSLGWIDDKDPPVQRYTNGDVVR